MIKIKENRDVFVPLGNILELSTKELQDVETFYLNILGKKGNAADEARQIIFCRCFGTTIHLSKIPFTSHALHLHALTRASAQTYIWKNALNPQCETLDFTNFGYKLENDYWLPLFINKIPFPTDLKNLVIVRKPEKPKFVTVKKIISVAYITINCVKSNHSLIF